VDVHDSLTPVIHLLEALRRRPEVSMVFLSSGGTVYGNPRTMPVTEDHPTDPTTSHGILKLAGEKYIGMCRKLCGYGRESSGCRTPTGPSSRSVGGKE
jgi:UDP-glucose 4-epimerase